MRHLPEIAENPYIDGFIIGPNDLSGSIGELLDIYGAHTQALIRETIAILKAKGKSIGISVGTADPEKIRFWQSLGINMISAGMDTGYLLEGARSNLDNMRRILSGT